MRKIVSLALCLCVLSSFVALFCGCAEKNERTSYDIVCELDGNVLVGKETVTFYNFTDNAFTELKFNLYGNAFRKDAKYSPINGAYASAAYPSGKSYGDVTITAVSDESGEAAYEICGEDENILKVALREELYPDESVSVTVEFTLTLAEVIARTGVNRDAVNLANFYPIVCGIKDGAFYECVYYCDGDPFFSDCSDYSVTLTCSEKYVVAASGEIVESAEQDGKKTYEYKIDNARSFAFVLSEKFNVATDVYEGTEIRYYYYSDETPEESLLTAVKAMRYFSETFGAYPYACYSVVETEFMQGGMEFPALVMISDALEPSAYREVVVHETAHQWWQTVVGNNEVEYGFLDEGLAEYSVVAFYENHSEYGFTRAALIDSAERTYKTFCTVFDKLFGKVDTKMVRSLSEFGSEYEYVNVAYVKSAIMYDTLRTSVGDAKFFSGLKKYYADLAFKNAEPSDIIAAFNGVGADVEGFFTGFFEGKVVL